MSDLFSIYPFVSNAFNLTNLESQEFSPEVEQLKVYAGGSLDPAMVAASFLQPMARLSTGNINTLLTNVSPLRGKKLTSWALQLQKRDEAGGAGDFTTGSTHTAIKSVSGCTACMIIDSISADKDARQIVTAGCSLYMYSSNGLVVPFSYAVTESLTASPAIGKVFALGPVLMESLTGGLKGVERATVNFGTQLNPDRDGGKIIPTRGTVGRRNPTVEIEAKSGTIAALTGAIGRTQDSGGGMTVYLQRIMNGSDRYAFDQSEHIALGFTTGVYKLENVGVNAEGDAMTKFTAHIVGQIGFTVDTTITLP